MKDFNIKDFIYLRYIEDDEEFDKIDLDDFLLSSSLSENRIRKLKEKRKEL